MVNYKALSCKRNFSRSFLNQEISFKQKIKFFIKCAIIHHSFNLSFIY